MPGTNWRTSTYSTSNGDCVEVANDGTTVLVRDSKAPAARLAVPAAAWQQFTARLRQ